LREAPRAQPFPYNRRESTAVHTAGAARLTGENTRGMASLARRLDTNVAGDFFVDAECIDCGTCRWMAPDVFDRRRGHSRVHAQPTDGARMRRAEQAAIACPVAAIGTAEGHDLTPARDSFPAPVDGPVHHCGFHSPDSYGAASYLIVRPAGNVLVDSPRFTGPLVAAIERLGGVATMFLTHRDDVADHARFAGHFGCARVLHVDDVTRGTADVERRIDGLDAVALDDELTVIPTPGHTRGSACLLFRERHLFSGDHVAWSREADRITAFRGACWYDWQVQTESMARLAGHRFAWILPGHGAPCSLPPARMAEEMQRCVAWMRRQ